MGAIAAMLFDKSEPSYVAKLEAENARLREAVIEVETILSLQQDSMHGQDFDAMQECRDKIKAALAARGK